MLSVVATDSGTPGLKATLTVSLVVTSATALLPEDGGAPKALAQADLSTPFTQDLNALFENEDTAKDGL